MITEQRIQEEIEAIDVFIHDCKAERKGLLNHVDNHDECEDLFTQIRKYSNYKIALEQVVKGVPIELGSY